MKKTVDLIFWVCALLSFCFLIRTLASQWPVAGISVVWLLCAVVLFGLLHVIKFIRLYFLLNESSICFWSLVHIYFRSTLVNLLVPFKTGEVYRGYQIGNEIGDYRTALLSIVTERFFDIGVVLIIMVTDVFFNRTGINQTMILFLLVLLGGLFVYNAFMPTFRYLNTFFVTKKPSGRDLWALRVLSTAKDWYLQQIRITRRKSLLIFGLSLCAWVVEYFTLLSVSQACLGEFVFSDFSVYITASIGLGSVRDTLSVYYISFSLVVTVLIFGVVLISRTLVRMTKNLNKKESNVIVLKG